VAGIIVDSEANRGSESKKLGPDVQLVSWVMGRVNRWRQYRDTAFKARWGEYYRLWRGRWSPEDRTRNSERSKLIAPALSQAIEMSAAEMEEATFGQEGWVDIADDVDDQKRDDMQRIRAVLLEDLHDAKVDDSISGAFLNGNLYGQQIAKIVVTTEKIKRLGPPDPETGRRKVIEEPRVLIKLDPIPADEFVPDPAGTEIDEMLGCAHEITKPLSWVHRMQTRGIFRKTAVIHPGATPEADPPVERADLEGSLTNEDAVFITEYHGLVPARLLAGVENPGKRSELDEVLDKEEIKTGDETLVEAIVTIGNKGELLRAVKNPFLMGDRSIVAAQHEKVPGRFWGRGTAEKGFNPQKALDAEMRARADALALITNPMMAADITSLPRGFDLRVRPGKLWLTTGSPKDSIQPLQFPGLDMTTFNQSGELERMVQMGTGAMDTATPIRQNKRNETATGTSLQAGTFVKRTKRALRNSTRNFISPLIQKILWRYMQFAPDRYPQDFKFKIVAGMGIVARELEQQQLASLVNVVPEGSPAQLEIVRGIVANAAVLNRREIEGALDSMLPTPEQQQRQELVQDLQLRMAITELQAAQAELRETESKVVLNMAKAQEALAKGQIDQGRFELDIASLQKEFEELKELRRQNDAALMTARANLIKAEKAGSGGQSSE